MIRNKSAWHVLILRMEKIMNEHMSILYMIINHQVPQTHTNFLDQQETVSFLIRTVFS